MNIRPLPRLVSDFLTAKNAPERLVRHLQIVHDTCFQLLDELNRKFQGLNTDNDAIRSGAALHDAGKLLHPKELYCPGRLHEEDGPEYLTENGFSPEIARFSQTHGMWDHDSSLPLDDLLVALSDAVWKGARIESLETLISQRIASQTGLEVWDCWMKLDEILTEVAQEADKRLAFQGDG